MIGNCCNCKYWIKTGFANTDDFQTCAYMTDEITMRVKNVLGNSYQDTEHTLDKTYLGLPEKRKAESHGAWSEGYVTTAPDFGCTEFKSITVQVNNINPKDGQPTLP